MLKDLQLDLMLVMNKANISDMLDGGSLAELGELVYETFEADRQSRSEWEIRNDVALKLALQVTEKKTFPWPDAANVKFPLLTIAAMQYHSRAYPALINGPKPVACRIMAPAPSPMEIPPPPPQAQQAPQQGGQQGGQQQPDPKMLAYQQAVQQIQDKARKEMQAYHDAQKKAQRISEHMSYQILEEDEQWEEEHDKLLLIQAIAGCAFKKTYFDPVSGKNKSECINPKDLVVSYYTKHLDTCPRASHIIPMYKNAVREKQVMGIFNNFREGEDSPPTVDLLTEMSVSADERSGTHANPSDRSKPYVLIEQHCWLDLDSDGYSEPYVVTIRWDTKQVMRVVARFSFSDIHTVEGQDKITRIDANTYFTKYPFIPSPDGGFYDIGFGALLGPINHSIDTALNQLLDAGSLANAGGGFLGRGFKGRKGDMKFKLGEWKQTDSTGDDLHKSIMPLPVKEPSGVLFNLLGLLIQYGQQVAGATDTMQGQMPGQNTPAETSRNTLEQGMKVFNGLYKRTHRSFTQELRKLYKLNAVFLSADSIYFTEKHQASSRIFQADYSGSEQMVKPAADPFYMSDSQRLQQATAVLQAAHSSPGYNIYLANKNYLEAMKVGNIDELLPDPKGPNAVPPPPNPKMQIEQMHSQLKSMDIQLKMKIKQMEIASDAEKIKAEIQLLQAEAVKTLAEAKGVDVGHTIALINAQIAAKKHHQDAALGALKIMQEVMHGQQEAPNGNQQG